MSIDAHLRVTLERLELDVDLAIGAGSTVALLGPNGAGKTSTLRALAGLLPLDSGHLTVAGRVLDEPADGVFVPPEARGIGVVFQEHRLFPHLDARDNVAFGLQATGTPRGRARQTARDWLARVGLEDFAAAKPASLSGGQAQRVALARALATRPDVLLLDEPLAALDPTTRNDMRRLLREQLADFSGVAVVVTHDPVDATMLADRVIVLDQGRVVQDDAPATLLANPRTPWVAQWAGTNLYRGSLSDGVTLSLDGGGHLVLGDAPDPLAPGGASFATIAPAAVVLHRSRPSGSARNTWSGTVATIEPTGSRVRVGVDGIPSIVAELTTAGVAALDLAVGAEVWVAVKATEITTYPA